MRERFITWLFPATFALVLVIAIVTVVKGW
jgi:hypothetical protein